MKQKQIKKPVPGGGTPQAQDILVKQEKPEVNTHEDTASAIKQALDKKRKEREEDDSCCCC